MFVADKKSSDNLRVRMNPGLKQQMDDAFSVHKISQQDGVNAIVSWFVDQPEEVRVLVLGTLPESVRSSAVRLMLERFDPETAAMIHAAEAERSVQRSQPARRGKKRDSA